MKREIPHTDSNNFDAEFPKINENPRITVARGTRDASVFDRLKMSRQTKIMNTSATDTKTASSFATIESTSYEAMSFMWG